MLINSIFHYFVFYYQLLYTCLGWWLSYVVTCKLRILRDPILAYLLAYAILKSWWIHIYIFCKNLKHSILFLWVLLLLHNQVFSWVLFFTTELPLLTMDFHFNAFFLSLGFSSFLSIKTHINARMISCCGLKTHIAITWDAVSITLLVIH